MAKYKNDHLRKQRHTTKDWLKYVSQLDKRDHLKELTQRNIKAAYAVYMSDIDYYYAAFQSPARNCPGWIQALQELGGYRFEQAVNQILRNGLHTK